MKASTFFAIFMATLPLLTSANAAENCSMYVTSGYQSGVDIRSILEAKGYSVTTTMSDFSTRFVVLGTPIRNQQWGIGIGVGDVFLLLEERDNKSGEIKHYKEQKNDYIYSNRDLNNLEKEVLEKAYRSIPDCTSRN